MSKNKNQKKIKNLKKPTQELKAIEKSIFDELELKAINESILGEAELKIIEDSNLAIKQLDQPLYNISMMIGMKTSFLRAVLYGHNQDRSRLYTIKEIPKRSGKIRTLHRPKYPLKKIQRKTLEYISAIYKPHRAAKGFVRDGGIIEHARIHRNKKLVASFDIKDFFPSITFARVMGMFKAYPFNFSDKEAVVFAQICCLPGGNGALPQGAPTSPYVSNMISRRLDDRFNKYALDNKFHYSRYADDLSFSSNNSFDFAKLEKFVSLVLKEEGFEINKTKSRLMRKSDRQVVTGIVVNEGLNVNRKYIKNLRAIIHNCKKTGINHQAKVSLSVEEFYKNFDNRITCTPFLNNKSGEKISEKNIKNINGRYLQYRNKEGKLLHYTNQIIVHFQNYIEGRLNFIKDVARANKDKKIRENRIKQVKRLLDKWQEVKNKDYYLSTKKYKPKVVEYERYKMEIYQKDNEELDRLIHKLSHEYNDARFFVKDFPDDLQEKRKEIFELLKFPAFSFEKTKDLAKKLKKGTLQKMVHRCDDFLKQDEVVDAEKNFDKIRYYIPIKIRNEVDNLFYGYKNVFEKNNTTKIKPQDIEELWDDLILKFKDSTRFDRSGSIFNNFIMNKFNSLNKKMKKNHRIVNHNLNDDGQFFTSTAIYTGVKNVKQGLSKIIESMIKHTETNETEDQSISYDLFFKNKKNAEKFSDLNNEKDDYKEIFFTIENNWQFPIDRDEFKDRKIFNGKLTQAMKNLNGMVEWYITFNTSDERITYDVFNNNFDCKRFLKGNGFKHTIVFYDKS